MSRAIPGAAAFGAALGFLLVVVFGASPASRADFPLDDAWIHLDYARGLLRDGVPTYNPGVPEAGFSSPLWLVVASAGLAVGGSSLPLAMVLKGLSAAFAGLAAAVLGRSALRASASPAVALALAAVAPLGPWWCAAAASGMEVTLALALLALALAAVVEDHPGRAGAWLALATLARPECGAAVLTLAALRALSTPGERVRSALAVAAPTSGAVAAWVAFDLVVTGRPLPNTFYVKAGTPQLGHAVAFAWATLSEEGAVVGLLLVALAALGLRATPRRQAAAWVALAVVPTVAVLASRPLDPAVLLYQRRYLYPFLGLLWWPAALGVQRLAALAAERASPGPRTLASVGLVFAIAVVVPTVASTRALHAAQCEDIATFHTAPAAAVAAHTPPDAVVAVEGAGAMRFFGGRDVVDLVGLNDHWLVRYPRGSTAHLCHLIRTRRPGWFVLPASWVPRFAPAWDFAVHASWRSDHYAQLEPPRRHRVVILQATPRPEALARCGMLNAPRAASPASPSAP